MSYVVKKGNKFWPSNEMKKIAWINNPSVYSQAEKAPVKFWNEQAKECIVWEKLWEEKNTYVEKLPYFEWFKGGKLNFCVNALDRHLKNPNKPALIWIPEPINEKPVILTYGELYEKVNKFANSLKDLGVKKGEAVSIYLPLVPEALVAMLACTRLGAIHSVVFSAFATDALKARIEDCKANVLITCDGYYRRGEKENLLSKAKKAIKGTTIKHVIVVSRLNKKRNYSGKFTNFNSFLEKGSTYCKPEIINSEDPMFILYTSGCCHPNSLIQLVNGEIVKIKEIVEKNIKPKIVNMHSNPLVQMEDNITNLHKYPNNSVLYKIRTPSFEAIFTPNHRLFSLDEYGNLIEKEVKNLLNNNKIFVISSINIKGEKQTLPKLKEKKEYGNKTTYKPENIPEIPNFLTSEFAQILGYFVGDGHLDKRSIIFTDKDISNLESYKNLILKELNVKSNIRKKSERLRLLVNSSLFRNYIIENFPEIATISNKRDIPKIIQKSEKECIAGFLRGLYDAEGTIGHSFIKLSSTSEELIRISQLLMRRFGIIAKVYHGINKERKIRNRVIKETPYLDVIISERESLNRFHKEIGFSDQAKKMKLNSLVEKLSSKKIFSKDRFPLFSLLKEITKTIKVDWKGDFSKITKFVHSNQTDKKGLKIIKEFLDNKIETETNKEKLEKLKIIRKKIQKLLEFKNAILEKILEIEKIDNEYDFVYDLTAEKNHNYIVNGIITHNTTGKPKGIVHDTGGYAVQAYLTAKWVFDIKDSDIMWCTADIGWITGHTYAFYGPLLNGATTLIYEGTPDFPNPSRWWQIIDKYKVSVFYTAPTAIRMFMKWGEKYLKKHKLNSLRILGTVGEPIDEKAWMWYFKNIGKSKCPILDTWWQTETGGTIINTLPGIGPFIPTVAGKSFPGTRHTILDKNGKKSSQGFLVQLSPFAPGMLHGVYNNHEKYVETYWKTFKGKYDTSDGAVMKESYFRITGRTDDVMKVAGHRLSTAELENSIDSSKFVNESAVVPIPDPIKGQTPIAFVVLKSGKPSEKLEQEIKHHVDKTLGPTSRPQKVYFVNDLPKTRSGKIMRRILKSILSNEEPAGLMTLLNPKCVEEIKKMVGFKLQLKVEEKKK